MAPEVNQFDTKHYDSKLQELLSTGETEEFFTPYEKVFESFDDMGFQENLLGGIYAYGFEKPSAIQQRGIVPFCKGLDVWYEGKSSTERFPRLVDLCFDKNATVAQCSSCSSRRGVIVDHSAVVAVEEDTIFLISGPSKSSKRKSSKRNIEYNYLIFKVDPLRAARGRAARGTLSNCRFFRVGKTHRKREAKR